MVGTKRSHIKKICDDDSVEKVRKKTGKKANSVSNYKKTHNIGSRSATNLISSYKESDVAVLFDKNYFSNFRCSMTFGRGCSKDKPKTHSSGMNNYETGEESEKHISSMGEIPSSSKDKSKSTRKSRASKRSFESGDVSGTPAESSPNKRARRTASLNAGAILTAMLEKTNSSSKKAKETNEKKHDSSRTTLNDSDMHEHSTPKSLVESPLNLKSSTKSKQIEPPKNTSPSKSFADMSCSPINFEEEFRRQNAVLPANGSKPATGSRKNERKSKVEKPKRILFEDVCIDLTMSSRGTNESAKVENQTSKQASSSNVNVKIHSSLKPTSSPTLSSSSSATILNLEPNPDSGRKSKSKKPKVQISKGSSLVFPFKTNQRLASLNAKAVLAACLDTPRKSHKAKKNVASKESEGNSSMYTPGTLASTPLINDFNNTGNNSSLCNDLHSLDKKKKQSSKSSMTNQSTTDSSPILLETPPQQDSAPSSSGSIPRPSKSLEKKQTRISPWKNQSLCVAGSSSRSGSHLLPSVSIDSNCAIYSQQSSIFSHLHQPQQNLSTGRPSSSAVVATILPNQICFGRPTAPAFSSYPTSGVPGPVTSLLLPRQHFPNQTPDSSLLRFPYSPERKLAYQNFGLLQCSGSSSNRPVSYPPQQQMGSPSLAPYMSPPTATVLIGSPQPHINLQLSPMAYGQVCRPFSPAAPSFLQTVPFSPERFQIYHAPSSPPLSLSGSSSHIFIPYSGSNRSTNTMVNLNSPSKTPCPESIGQAQSKKKASKGKISGTTDSGAKSMQFLNTMSGYSTGIHHYHPQYVRISPKKPEQSTSTVQVSTSSDISSTRPTSATTSSSEVGKILKFAGESDSVTASVAADLIDLSGPKPTKVPPTIPAQNVKAKKRTRTGEQKNDVTLTKRAHKSKPDWGQSQKPSKGKKASHSLSKHEVLRISETSSEVILESSLEKIQTVDQNGSLSSICPTPSLTPPTKSNQDVDIIDTMIDCSVVIMTSPLKTSQLTSSKTPVKFLSTKKNNKLSIGSDLASKNKSTNNKRGRLLSVGFLKSLSPSRSLIKGSPKVKERRGKRSEKSSKEREILHGNEKTTRKNGLKKNEGLSSKKMNLSSTGQTKNSSDDVTSWSWMGASTTKPISIQGDGSLVERACYPAIQHVNGDIVKVRDCVFVRSGTRKRDIPYIAKIYGLWEEGDSKEMMMGVFWYYRREHIDSETVASRYLDDEVFASRHRDVVPVACIEDKCFVLPLNHYCRYRAEVSRLECGARMSLSSSIVPPLQSVNLTSENNVLVTVPTTTPILSTEEQTVENEVRQNSLRDDDARIKDASSISGDLELPNLSTNDDEQNPIDETIERTSVLVTDKDKTELTFKSVSEVMTNSSPNPKIDEDDTKRLASPEDTTPMVEQVDDISTNPSAANCTSSFNGCAPTTLTANEVTSTPVDDGIDDDPVDDGIDDDAKTYLRTPVDDMTPAPAADNSSVDIAMETDGDVINPSRETNATEGAAATHETISHFEETDVQESFIKSILNSVIEGVVNRCSAVNLDDENQQGGDDIVGSNRIEEEESTLEITSTPPNLISNDISLSLNDVVSLGTDIKEDGFPSILDRHTVDHPLCDVESLKELCSKVVSSPQNDLLFSRRPMLSASFSCLGLITVFSSPTVTTSMISNTISSQATKESCEDGATSTESQMLCLPTLSKLTISVVQSTEASLPKSDSVKSSFVAATAPPAPAEQTDRLKLLGLPPLTTSSSFQSATDRLAKEVDRDNVFLCRHIYDIKLRRISKNPNIALQINQAQPTANNGGSNSGSNPSNK